VPTGLPREPKGAVPTGLPREPKGAVPTGLPREPKGRRRCLDRGATKERRGKAAPKKAPRRRAGKQSNLQ